MASRFFFESRGVFHLRLSLDGSVLFAGARDALYAFDALTGMQKWSFTPPQKPRTTPLVTASFVIIAAGASILAMDSASGKVSWSSPMPHEVQSIALTPDSSTIIAASTQGVIWGINATDGRLRWNYTQQTPVQSGGDGGAGDIRISADGTTIYYTVAQVSNATVHAINVSGVIATHLWTHELSVGASVAASPPALSADGSMLFVCVTSDVVRLVALSTATGTPKWTFNITGPAANPLATPATPTVGTDGAIYISTASDGVVCSLSATGSKRWEYPTRLAARTTLALTSDGSGLYVGGKSDSQFQYSVLYAVDTRSGSKSWEFRTTTFVTSIVSNGDDSTVFATDGEYLYAVEGAVIATRSPTAGGPPTAAPGPAGGGSDDGGNKTKGIVIGVVAALLVILVIVIAVFIVIKRNRFKESTNVVNTL